ncbi:MAG: Dihydroneopterin aldolase [uncultured Sulfurovum sp.]|uniref:Dihydroneopterin aldolase n=1 Tax=uncultured Sulfurovum sp. TaxID=269237 RepID=A0A6S6UJ04_9BACT|nr:MAG: Dihydroneopterin aldolase [uncultured Sulfurovum sp.]
MTIHIEELTFDCIIGILDFERLEVQKIIIDLSIDYHYYNNFFINYAQVIALVQKDMINNKYELLETALNELEIKLLSTYPQIKRFTLKITKPNIINNAKVSLSKNFSNL